MGRSSLIWFIMQMRLQKERLDDYVKEKVKQRIMANRRHAADLTAIYFELPCCYKWYLKSKSIRPDLAVPGLIGLSNTFNFEHADKRISKIQELLGITPPVV